MQILKDDTKRLFLGLALEAAWMHPLPEGRILTEDNRHLTLAFLGNQSLSCLQTDLKDFPIQFLGLGPAGICNRLIFLPQKMPRVVAGHVDWFDQQEFLNIHREVNQWLATHEYPVDPRELLSHVTIARAPFHIAKWKKAFFPFPIIARSLNLYESLGNLSYKSVWSIPFIPPLNEVEHTADIAFHIRGKDIKQLYRNSQLALAFKFPEMLHYFSEDTEIQGLDDLIIHLNRNVSQADAEVGCPFKAVSFHGEIIKEKSGFLLWEMIVDV